MTDPKPPATEATFHYIKAPTFRTLHVDGVYGGLTPSGLLHLAVFNERQPIPERATYILKEGGIDSERLDLRQTKQGFVREVEANLMMTVETAELMRDWLTANIDILKRALGDAGRG